MCWMQSVDRQVGWVQLAERSLHSNHKVVHEQEVHAQAEANHTQEVEGSCQVEGGQLVVGSYQAEGSQDTASCMGHTQVVAGCIEGTLQVEERRGPSEAHGPWLATLGDTQVVVLHMVHSVDTKEEQHNLEEGHRQGVHACLYLCFCFCCDSVSDCSESLQPRQEEGPGAPPRGAQNGTQHHVCMNRLQQMYTSLS